MGYNDTMDDYEGNAIGGFILKIRLRSGLMVLI